MPLIKSTPIDTGDTGEFFKLTYMHWDEGKKQVSAHFALYKTQAAYTSGSRPQVPIIAKVRCQGAKFDQYFSEDVMSKSGKTHTQQVHWVAMNDPSCVISDYHKVDNPMFAGAKLV